MGIFINIKRTGFYNDLSNKKQDEYLSLSRDKILPFVDTLYYSVFIYNDGTDEVNSSIKPFIHTLENLQMAAVQSRESVQYNDNLLMTFKRFSQYSFCLTASDLYDVFICRAFVRDSPRIVVQLRSFGLWTVGVEEIFENSYNEVKNILSAYDLSIGRIQETRIDYCYHTNAISSPNALFKEMRSGVIKNLYTNLSRVHLTADTQRDDNGTKLFKDYVCFGEKQSNNVRARIYDKVKEVIEMGYKNFFFNIWYDNGLVSYYDKWCMEYAFPYNNQDYLHKARIAFYVEHMKDIVCIRDVGYVEDVKDISENFESAYAGNLIDIYSRLELYKQLLDNPLTSLIKFKEVADEYMPQVTAILNIEYETKRKFYYYSDDFINGFKTLNREYMQEYDPLMNRIYKMLDNKSIFLDYLTSKTLTFHRGDLDENGEPKYLSWWKRLRNVNLGGIKSDQKLIREYSYNMDKKHVLRRMINSVAAAAVYDDRLETGFIEDLSDELSNLNDNNAHKLYFVDYEGVIIDEINSGLFSDYKIIKAKKELHLRNRKKKQGNINIQEKKQE